MAPPWLRYVAIGDSSTEGLEDPYPNGSGYRGWADRLAERLAQQSPDLLYANLAIRGRLASQVREEQLEAALALGPDLVSIVAGLNDSIRPGWDLDRLSEHLDEMIAAVREAGADALTFTYPDPGPINRFARGARPRLFALNEKIREIASRRGAYLADFEHHPVASDPRLWHPDRLHANSEGHRRIAAALAHALELPGADESWAEPLPVLAPARVHRRLAADALWAGTHAAPWVVRRLRGRSSGDGRAAKRPDLGPLG